MAQAAKQTNDSGLQTLVAAGVMADVGTRRAVLTQMYASNLVEQFKPVLVAIRDAIIAALALMALNNVTRARLNQQLNNTSNVLNDIYSGYTDRLQQDLIDFADYEAQFTTDAIDQVSPDFSPNKPSFSQIALALLAMPMALSGADRGKLLAPYLEQWAQDQAGAVVGLIRLGQARGDTRDKIIASLLGTPGLRYKDGLLDITARNAGLMVRTVIQQAASVGRTETYSANADIVTGYQWVATLDGKTCQVCRSLDLKVFKLDKGPQPPIHYQCRCNLIPYFGPDLEFLNADQQAGTSRVNYSQSYYEWLQTQSDDFQDTVLGPTRGQLFRDGGLSADRFAALQLDRNFMPLTLADMRKLDPIAFKRAGI